MSILYIRSVHELIDRNYYLDDDFLYSSGDDRFITAAATHLGIARDAIARLYQRYDERGELLNPETETPEMFEARERLEVRFVLALGDRYCIDSVWDDWLRTIPIQTTIERTEIEEPMSFSDYRDLWTEYLGDLWDLAS